MKKINKAPLLLATILLAIAIAAPIKPSGNPTTEEIPPVTVYSDWTETVRN